LKFVGFTKAGNLNMSKYFWRAFTLAIATVLTSLFLIVGHTLLVNATIVTPKFIAQVSAVEQMEDIREIKSNEYYYQGLQSLVEKYGCVTANSNRQIQARRALQSGEYVNYLGYCLDRMNELIASALSDIPDAESLTTAKEILKDIESNVNSIRR
jgi:hypothetical protein